MMFFSILFSVLLLLLLVAGICGTWSEWGESLSDKLIGSLLVFLGVSVLGLGIVYTMLSDTAPPSQETITIITIKN